MRKSKKAQPVKLFHVISGLFLVISIVVFIVLGFAVQYQDLQETYTLAEDTASFLKTECKKFENYDMGNSARSLQDLLDAAVGLELFILPSQDVDDDLLNDFIRTEHVGGVIIMDNSFSVIAQADMDHQDSFSIWEETLNKTTIQDIAKNPGKTYVDQVTLNNVPYDFGVAASEDGKWIILCYSSRMKPDVDPYEYTISSILTNNKLYKNPTMVITDGERILSTNNPDLENLGKKEYKLLKSAVDWKENQLTKFKYQGNTWYGLRRLCGDYYVYAMYPESEVFSRRTNFIVYGFMVYLVLCLIVLSVQRYFDKQNMRKMAKQLRIIDAISTSYLSTFLFHIDERTLEAVKPSDFWKELLERNQEPEALFQDICRNYVSEEYRDMMREFMNVGSLAERMKDQRYIGAEFQGINGKWYSVSLIAQKYDEGGNLQAVIVATRDVTAMKQAEELSYKDKLTGLYNRNYMEAKSREFLQEGAFPVSVIMADCNYLKRTNDTMGHEYGDMLLQRVAEGIKAVLPDECTAMRVGGDEFFIVCRATSQEKAEKLVARMREQMQERSDDTLQVSVSFGVCTVENGERTFTEAYEAADQEMHKEKMAARAGRE